MCVHVCVRERETEREESFLWVIIDTVTPTQRISHKEILVIRNAMRDEAPSRSVLNALCNRSYVKVTIQNLNIRESKSSTRLSSIFG